MIGFFAALLVAVLCAALFWALAKIERLEKQARFNAAHKHALCLLDIKETVSGAHDATLLNRLADRWDSAEEQGNLRILAREEYSPGGPSMPALWLRQQARLAQGATDGMAERINA